MDQEQQVQQVFQHYPAAVDRFHWLQRLLLLTTVLLPFPIQEETEWHIVQVLQSVPPVLPG